MASRPRRAGGSAAAPRPSLEDDTAEDVAEVWQGSGKVGQVGRACGIAAGFRRRLRMGTGPKGRIAVKQQILVVEDDARIADLIVKNLEAVGYACHASPDGGRALADYERLRPALVVLDLGLGGLDGLEVARRIRKESDVPILMVTARTGESDKLLGLEIGADDYVTKPFSTAELVARVRALLRRSTGTVRERTIELGGLAIDPARRVVEREGKPVPLSTLEFDLLYFLASRPGRVFSREALMQQVWGSDRVVDDRSIDSLVSRLRQKLEPDTSQPRFIQTVWGAGYRFAEYER